MKQLFTIFLVLGLVVPCLAITTEEVVNTDKSVTISITFQEDEYTMFGFDKEPVAWITNFIYVNLRDKLRYETTLPSPKTPEEENQELLERAKKIKAEKEASLLE